MIPPTHLRGFSLDELITHFEACHDPIKSPLTPDECSLVRAVAEARYFSDFLRELPARAARWDTVEAFAFWWGISQVCRKRGDTPN